MELTGTLHIPGPLPLVLDRLADPATLQAILPSGAEIAPKAEGLYGFTLRKTLAQIEIRQSGDLTIAPQPPEGIRVSLSTSHRLAGSVRLDLVLRAEGLASGQTRLSYTGTLTATGLAARLMRGRDMAIRGQMDRLLQRLKARILSAPSA